MDNVTTSRRLLNAEIDEYSKIARKYRRIDPAIDYDDARPKSWRVILFSAQTNQKFFDTLQEVHDYLASLVDDYID